MVSPDVKTGLSTSHVPCMYKYSMVEVKASSELFVWLGGAASSGEHDQVPVQRVPPLPERGQVLLRANPRQQGTHPLISCIFCTICLADLGF